MISARPARPSITARLEVSRAGKAHAGMIITDVAKAAAHTVKENEKVGCEPESVDR